MNTVRVTAGDLHQGQGPVEISLSGRGIAGQILNFLLTAKWDAAAARCFFRKAMRHQVEPEVVTTDKRGSNTAVLPRAMPVKKEAPLIIKQSHYLNNLVGQDIKRPLQQRLGFKSFRRTQTIRLSIETAYRPGKGQYTAKDGISTAGQWCLLVV